MAYQLDYLAIAYSFAVLIGGAVGFMKAGSIISLVMGFSFGFILIVGAKQTSEDPKNVVLSLVAATILGIVMGLRYINSNKFMPAGLVALFSIISVVRNVSRYMA